MKYIVLFENYPSTSNSENSDVLYKCWKNAKIGDILPESDIYQYIEKLHKRNWDFTEGDLGERIEEYSRYRLREVYISKINIDEWEIDEDDIDIYQKQYELDKDYPPIVLEKEYMSEYTIIDGTHRCNVLYKLGIKTIKAWVGL